MKTRSRNGLLVVAVLLGIAARPPAASVQEGLEFGTPQGPVWPDGQEALERELDERIDRLPPERGPWETPPREEHPATDLLRRRLAESPSPTDAQWRRLLLEKGVLRFRERWPAQVPYAVGIRIPDWLPLGGVRLVPRRAGLATARASRLAGGCGLGDSLLHSFEAYQALGSLPEGAHGLGTVGRRSARRPVRGTREGQCEWMPEAPLTAGGGG